MQVMTAKITTLRTIYVHVVLNIHTYIYIHKLYFISKQASQFLTAEAVVALTTMLTPAPLSP